MPEAVEIGSADRLSLADCRRLILSSEPWITLGYGEAEAERIAAASAADRVLVARRATAVVGFAISTPGVLLGEYLKLLVVDPAYRAAGVGRRLMQALEARAFAQWPNVYLCVSDFNTDAQAFYRRIGYTVVGPLPDLVLPGAGEILMRKSIAAWRTFRAAP